MIVHAEGRKDGYRFLFTRLEQAPEVVIYVCTHWLDSPLLLVDDHRHDFCASGTGFCMQPGRLVTLLFLIQCGCIFDWRPLG